MPHSGLGASNAGVTDNSVGGSYSNHPDYASSSGPQTESAPYEGTGTSQYGNNVESSTSGTAGEDGVKHGGGAKGIAAAVHGVGEKIRGTFNKGVDGAFHEVGAKHTKLQSPKPFNGEEEKERLGGFDANLGSRVPA